MSWISAADPLALVAIQAGQIGTPASERAAAGSSQLDSEQRSIEIGEPVPIVFARRRNGAGGVLVSPGASECRFENDNSNAVTASYLLVLGEGQMDNIPVKDVFQRSCRVGSHSQTYNRRAGTWTPANAIVQRSGYDMPEASYYCGSVGAYPGMTTVSFQVTIPDGFDQWKKQVHFFIRGGMRVTRLFDAVTGPSDNFADLVRWLLQNTTRLPAALIDTTTLTSAAQFLETNGFTCNCVIQESTSYSDLLSQWAPGFLLCESNVAGKRGLRPLLPTTTGGAINTGVITPAFTFTVEHILPDSLEIQYTSLTERRPFVVQVIWRQQLEDDFGIIRTAEVRYANTAETGPYESHDLSEFCTSENHAVKVGAYILASRVYTSHTVRFTAKPEANNTAVVAGSIVRVQLARQTSAAGTSYHDYLYQVQRITKTLGGELSYECVHFPVDSQGRSLVALAVSAVQGTGILLTSNKSGVGCDVNSSSDNTVPAETFSSPDTSVTDAGEETELEEDPTITAGSGGLGATANPTDGLEATAPVLGALTPRAGSQGTGFTPPAQTCAGAQYVYTTADLNAKTGAIIPGTFRQQVVSDWTIPVADMRNNALFEFSAICPDGTTQKAEPVTSWYNPATAAPPALWTFDEPQVCSDRRWVFTLTGANTTGPVNNGPFTSRVGSAPYLKNTGQFTDGNGRINLAMNVTNVNCNGNEQNGIDGVIFFYVFEDNPNAVSLNIIRQERRANSNAPWTTYLTYQQ